MKNIFVVGSQVKGESQIGYKRHIKKIARLLTDNSNISITGLPRFGKTSLVKTVLNSLKQYDDSGLLIIFLDLAKYKTFSDVLEAIWIKLEDSLHNSAKPELLETKIFKLQTEKVELAIKNGKLNHLRMGLENCISWISDQNFKIILVMDEFDAASNIFTSTSDFEYFRDLASNSDFDLSLLLISRRPVYMIEKKNLIQSTFHGVLQSYPINGFNLDDMDQYFSILDKLYDIRVNDSEKNVLLHYCGRSPFLFSIIGHELVEMLEADGPVCIEKAYRNNEVDFRNYFNSIASNLSEDVPADSIFGINGMSTLHKLIALIIGPKINLTERDLHFMEDMGYLFTDQSRYFAISPSFTNFLREHPVNSDVWNSLIGLQKKINAMIRKQVMKDKKTDYILYDVWQEIFELAGVGGSLDTYDDFIKDAMETYAESVDLLDVCSLRASTQILRVFWEKWFSPFFNHDRWDKWNYKFELCAKARDPMAHGHEEYLSVEEKTAVECYCKEILKILSESNACLDKDAELILSRSIACKEASLSYAKYARENVYAKITDELKNKIIIFNVAHQTKDRLEGFFDYNGSFYQGKIKRKQWEEWMPGVSLSEHLGKQYQLRVISVDKNNNSLQFEWIPQ